MSAPWLLLSGLLPDELPPNLVWGADVADEIRAAVAGKR